MHILRAFVWMRWRVLVNSLERTPARDTLQRLSLAVEKLTPIVYALITIPSMIGMAALAGFAGYQLAVFAGGWRPFQIARVVLLGATFLTVAGPIMMPTADRTNPVRLLLLPIPARVLYIAHGAAAITDPWILVLSPIVVALPIGLVMGGAAATALVALVAGALMIVTLVGLSALVTTAVHLVLRDRRRGELLTLAAILMLPLLSIAPSMIAAAVDRGPRDSSSVQTTRRQRPGPEFARPPRWVISAGSRVVSILPSELYARSVRVARQSGGAAATGTVVAMAASALAIHAFGVMLFYRVLGSPGTTGPRRAASRVWRARLPGLAPQTSAIALGLWKLALRTPRGRSILLAPLLMLVVFGFVALRSRAFQSGQFGAASGLGIAAFVAFVSLIATLPISVNQFAVDGAGLTMALLSPLRTRQLLIGKAVGVALIAMPPALIAIAIASLASPVGPVSLWLALLLGIAATYVLVTPAAATLSALFPRIVDLNSIGRSSNAHGIAGLLGLLSFAVSALPCVGIVALAYVVDRPVLAPVLMLLWCAAAMVIARYLFVIAERVFESRRESLTLLI